MAPSPASGTEPLAPSAARNWPAARWLAYSLLLVAASALLLFPKALLGGETFAYRDLESLIRPWRRIPLWNCISGHKLSGKLPPPMNGLCCEDSTTYLGIQPSTTIRRRFISGGRKREVKRASSAADLRGRRMLPVTMAGWRMMEAIEQRRREEANSRNGYGCCRLKPAIRCTMRVQYWDALCRREA